MEFTQVASFAVGVFAIVGVIVLFSKLCPNTLFARFVHSLPYMLIIGLTCIFVAAVFMLRSGSSTNAYIAFLSIFILIPAVFTIWNYSPLGKRLNRDSGHNYETTVAQMTGNAELGSLKGKFGRTISALRPSGVAEFDDRRVDVITEGMMVSAGEWVKCVDVRAGKVIVRPAEKPPLSDLENADFS